MLKPIEVKCIDCTNLKSTGAGQPYPEIWCGSGEFDGVANIDELYAPSDCELFKAEQQEKELVG